MRAQVGPLIGPQRLAHHQRPEIRATNTDVNDVRDGLAGRAAPFAAPHALGERLDARKNRTDVGHDVLTIDHHRPVATIAQRDMQHRAVLGGVDLLTGEHAIAPGLQIGGSGEVEQEANGLAIDALLGEVDQQVVEAQAIAIEPVGLGLEQLAQMPPPFRARMRLEGSPGGIAGEGRHAGRLPSNEMDRLLEHLRLDRHGRSLSHGERVGREGVRAIRLARRCHKHSPYPLTLSLSPWERRPEAGQCPFHRAHREARCRSWQTVCRSASDAVPQSHHHAHLAPSQLVASSASTWLAVGKAGIAPRWVVVIAPTALA